MITIIRWSRKILIPGIKGYKWSRRVQKRAKHDCIQIFPYGLFLMELDSIWVQATCCMQLEKQYQLLVNNWAKPTVGKNQCYFIIGLQDRYGIGDSIGGAQLTMEEVWIVQTGNFTWIEYDLDLLVPPFFPMKTLLYILNPYYPSF